MEQKPAFQGSDTMEFTKWVFSQIKYPEEAKEKQIQGRVTLQFTIAKDGNVKDVTVVGPNFTYKTQVVERQAKILTITNKAIIQADNNIHVEVLDDSHLKLYGGSSGNISITYTNGTCKTSLINFNESTEQVLEF